MAFYRAGFLPFVLPGGQTATAIAQGQLICQNLIDQALRTSNGSCQKIGANQVCYGNDTLQAELIPGIPHTFMTRGDTVNVTQIRRISASPLNPNDNKWGIAVLRVMANLPHSLPGETVTMMVFGNTTLDNKSQNLETFYFSSTLGQVVCDKVPFDGVVLTMPEGAGVHFTVNGSELTLMGNASMKAVKNGDMEVALYSGAGKIKSQGVEQTFGAGQKVSVDLGGPNGTDAVGPPSAPQPLSPAEMSISCTMTGGHCAADEITPVSPQQAADLIQNGPPRTPTITASALPSITPTPSETFTPTPTLTKIPSLTPFYTRTNTRTPSRTPLVSPTRTRTFTPTPTILTRTPTRTPTRTLTPLATFTRTVTATATSTATATGTPTLTLTATATGTVTLTLTATATGTATATSTATATPTPSSTPTETATLTPTVTAPSAPVACTNVNAGALTPGGTDPAGTLTVTLTNNEASAINLEILHVEWLNTSNKKIVQVELGAGSIIWSGNENNPPSDFPTESAALKWEPTGNRQIPSGANKDLILTFGNTPFDPGTYLIRATFDINCFVESTTTIP